MAVIIPNVAQMRLTWSNVPNRPQNNVLHFDTQLAGPINQDMCNALAVVVTDALTSSLLKNNLKTTYALVQVGLRDLSVANAAEFLANVNTVGLSAEPFLPLQTAAVATLRTNKAGRSFRGRYYQGGYTEGASSTAGRIEAAVRTRLVDFLTTISEDADAGLDLRLCVASRTLLLSNRVTQVVSRDDVWDTQRRRNRPLG